MWQEAHPSSAEEGQARGAKTPLTEADADADAERVYQLVSFFCIVY
jgi:hypothetical protein